jgi:hypothetical protein
MKRPNLLTKLTLLFAVLLTLGAAQAQADILPGVTIRFAPVGLTMDQTARLNLVNVDVPNGMLIHWRFIDASGVPRAEATVILPLGKIVSVDYRRAGDPLPPKTDPAEQIRARCESKWKSSALASRPKACAEAWRYLTMIPALPRYSWAVVHRKQPKLGPLESGI